MSSPSILSLAESPVEVSEFLLVSSPGEGGERTGEPISQGVPCSIIPRWIAARTAGGEDRGWRGVRKH